MATRVRYVKGSAEGVMVSTKYYGGLKIELFADPDANNKFRISNVQGEIFYTSKGYATLSQAKIEAKKYLVSTGFVFEKEGREAVENSS